MNPTQHLQAVVLAGGSGTRFWPLSRPHRPKQLIDLSGQGVLLWQTFDRLASLVTSKESWMVVGKSHAQGCMDAAPDIPVDQVLIEPSARNTAAAIGLAAVHLVHSDPESMMVILPADHHVRDAQSFCKAIGLAASVAHDSTIVTLGIQPSRPETGYGYIECGKAREISGAFDVSAFKEKPEASVAKDYLASGNYYWNAGVFIARADTMLEQLKLHQKELYAGLMEIAGFIGKSDYHEHLERIYSSLPSISIDYAVMENASDIAVVPVECGWSDVGSLATLDGVVPADENENLVLGKALTIDTQGCTLLAENNHLIATIGLKDMVVVHTEDTTLVLPKNRAQEVKSIVALLKENK